MASFPNLFLSTIDNSIHAIRERRYDLVQISGNRLLSDLTIFERNLSQEQASYISFIGLFVRRIGIDLSSLSQNSHDSAKLKQRAIDAISTVKASFSKDNHSSLDSALEAYQRYEEIWADEVNANDLAKYNRDGTSDVTVYNWAIESLNNLPDTENLVFSYPISAISNEMIRMSYMERFSTRSVMLTLTLRSLEWLSVTTNQLVQVINEGMSENEKRQELVSRYETKILDYVSSTTKLFEKWTDKSAHEILHSVILDNLVIVKNILIEWRKMLNTYYQLSTPVPTKLSKSKQEKDKNLEDVDEELQLRRQHKRIPK